MRLHFHIVLICLLLLTGNTVAQTYTEQGSPYIRNYTTTEFNGGGPQIWCWVQDKRGMVYVGDMDGIIEFNGKDWKRIPNENNSIVRSMAADSLGRIFVGCSNDFGFLQPNYNGNVRFISLSKPIADKGIKFMDIWKVFANQHGIYFCSNKYVFRYSDKKVSVIPVDFMVQDTYLLNNQLYLPTKKGLYNLRDTTLVLVSTKVSFALTTWHGNELLSRSGSGKLCTFNLTTSEIKEFKTQAQHFFEENPLREIVRIDENKLAVATETNKILIITNNGDILQFIDKENGLTSGYVSKLFVDKEKNLWVCHSKGISKIDINFPVLKFGEKQNINSNVMSSFLFNRKRYIGTIDGLYYLPPFNMDKPDESQKFIKIKTEANEFWNFMVVDEKLYAISSSGLWVIDDTKAKRIFNIESPQKAHCFNTNPLFPNVVFVGMRGKMLALKLNGSRDVNKLKVVNEMDFDGINEKIRRITSDKDGNLWLNTQYDGVYFVRFINGNIHNYRVTLLGKQNGLPKLDGTQTYKVNNEIIIATGSGVLQPVFPAEGNAPDSLIRFEPTMLFGDTLKDAFAIVTPVSESKYLIASTGIRYATLHGTKQAYDSCGFFRMSCDVGNISVDSDSIISLCSSDGLFNYDSKNHRNFKRPFNTIVSKVEINNDSTLFGGCFYTWRDSTKIASLTQNPELIPSIDFKYNSITFHFAALFYEDPEVTEFQYQLVGFDKKWSNSSTENKAVYTNLPNGKYTFRVKAQNAYWKMSNVADYQFTITPPWYRTWWAYLIYVLLFASIIYVAIILYTRQLRRQKEYLESVVEDRTWSIIEQANELKTINEKLVEMDKFKQGVTSMIVHDLKNPINAIINSGNSNPETQLNRIKQTGKQMLNLVLNILDVSKYEETQISLAPRNINLLDISSKAIDQVLFLCNEKNITISNQVNQQLAIRADNEMIERVFVNILTNAIKYTHNNGEIVIEAETVDQFVKIAFTDNGLGIPADKIHLVFLKFGQVIAKNSGSVRSSGLGLTYCKMVVEAHGGKIDVISEPEKGSTFWFTLPGVEVENGTGQTTTFNQVPRLKSIVLSDENKQLLNQYLIELQQTELYKITELTIILEKIDDSVNSEIMMWKQDLIRAIDSGNELLYKNLIAL